MGGWTGKKYSVGHYRQLRLRAGEKEEETLVPSDGRWGKVQGLLYVGVARCRQTPNLIGKPLSKTTYSIAMFDATMGVESLNKIGQLFRSVVVLGESLMGEKQ